ERELAPFEVHVLDVERQGGSDADPGAEEEGEEGVVPRVVDGGEQARGLDVRERPRERPAAEGPADQPGGILADHAGLVQVAEEAPERPSQRVDAVRLLDASVWPGARDGRRQERGDVLVAHVGDCATWAKPGRQGADVAGVLPAGVLGPTVGLELDEESGEGV